MGTEKQRKLALAEKADVYVIGRDSFVWLVGIFGGMLPFDVLVIDELTSFKSSKSNRFKAMRMATPTAKRVIGLTGTPAPNGLIDLWAQMYCIDMGERLGRSVTKYRETYFETHKWNNIIVRCNVKKGYDEVIRKKIADICLSMQAKDYLQLPDLINHTIKVQLSTATMQAYTKFEREKVLQFQDEHQGETANVLAQSAAGLMNKLSQFANGAIYDEDRNVHNVHDEKLDRLAEIIEAANGSSVLVFYQYKHDAARIAEKFKGYRVKVYTDEKQLIEWNAGQVDILLAHPASTAFGLNMQDGGHYIVWFGTGWNLELYQQANARLHRQGQQYPVQVYNLVCSGTVDERAVTALENKKGVQQGLLDSLNYLIRKHSDLK
jgi:SNF2 family DNA or RNA helicase